MWSSEREAQLCDATELSDTGLSCEQHGRGLAQGCSEAGVSRIDLQLSSELPRVALGSGHSASVPSVLGRSPAAVCCIALPHPVGTQ